MLEHFKSSHCQALMVKLNIYKPSMYLSVSFTLSVVVCKLFFK